MEQEKMNNFTTLEESRLMTLRDKGLKILEEKQPHFFQYFMPRFIGIFMKNYFSYDVLDFVTDGRSKPSENELKDIHSYTTISDIIGSYYDSLETVPTGNKATKEKTLKENMEHLREFEQGVTIPEDTILYDIYTTIGENGEQNREPLPEHMTTEDFCLKCFQYTLDHYLYSGKHVEHRLETFLKINARNFQKVFIQQEIMNLLRLKYEFFMVDEKKGKNIETSYYMITTENGSQNYTEIDRAWLHKLLKNISIVPLFHTLPQCEKILEYTETVRQFDDSYCELENVYIKKETMEIIDKTENNQILTRDRLGIKDTTTGAVQLFKYDPTIDMSTITEENKTETYKILEQILIPKDNPMMTDTLHFYFQILGLMVHGTNDIKVLPICYQKGDNGKSILINVIEYLFTDGVVNIRENSFKDNFIHEYINNSKHAIVNDELEENDIQNNAAVYKTISGNSGLGGRLMYGSGQLKVPDVSPMWLCGNYVPNIPVNTDWTAVINRLVLIKMPNMFVSKTSYNETENHYIRRTNIKQLISHDKEGLEQVLSIAINEFKKLDYSKDVRNQLALTPTRQETMHILSHENPLINYLGAYVEEMDSSTPKALWIGTDDIRENFTRYYQQQNYGQEPPLSLFGNNNEKIGKAVKSVFGIDKHNPRYYKKEKRPVLYALSILDENQKSLTNKTIFKWNEMDMTEPQHNISGITQYVYQLIRDTQINNEKDLIMKCAAAELKEHDVMCALRQLDNIGLIEYTEQTVIDY